MTKKLLKVLIYSLSGILVHFDVEKCTLSKSNTIKIVYIFSFKTASSPIQTKQLAVKFQLLNNVYSYNYLFF